MPVPRAISSLGLFATGNPILSAPMQGVVVLLDADGPP